MTTNFQGLAISRRVVLLGAGLLAFSGSASADLVTFTKSKLVITTAKGQFPFDIELALTPPQMAQGLMYRRTLAADAGMLFDYGDPQSIAMWMKNTFIPLDMIFVGKDGKVVGLHERAVPMSLDTIESKVPAKAVIEVNAGTIGRLGIQIGDTVHYTSFGNALN
jgi:uncharacterized membrane protein (UPF0127 family)